MIRLSYGPNFIFYEYFDFEIIGDVLTILTKKYGFIADDELSIFQNGSKLQADQKIIDMLNKNDLKIKGNLVSKKKNTQEEVESKQEPKNYLEKIRQMGFKESDEKINQFLRQYNNNVKEVATQLLLAQKKSKK